MDDNRVLFLEKVDEWCTDSKSSMAYAKPVTKIRCNDSRVKHVFVNGGSPFEGTNVYFTFVFLDGRCFCFPIDSTIDVEKIKASANAEEYQSEKILRRAEQCLFSIK